MARRIRENPRLLRLLVCFLLFFPASVYSEPLETALTLSSSEIAEGDSFTVTVLVRHPNPPDVAVSAPAFPKGISTDRVGTEPRLLPAPSGADERWTAVEYRLTARAAGSYSLGPFVAAVAGEKADAGSVSIVVTAAAAKETRFLFWGGLPASASVGVPFDCRLVASGFVPGDDIAVAVPENAVFQRLPSAAGDLGSGIAARYRVRPLVPGLLVLPSASVPDGAGKRISAPSISLRVAGAAVSAAVPRQQPLPASSASSGSARTSPSAAPSFPPDTSVPRFLLTFLAEDLAASRNLWTPSSYSESLLRLRTAERNSLFGFALRPARRAAERSLGLPDSENTVYAPIPLIIAFAAAAAAFGGLAAVFYFWGVTSARSRRFLILTLVAALCGIAAASLSFSRFFGAAGVVLNSCDSYRVPDPSAARSASFFDGEGAVVRSRAGDWLYVETGDGRSGWINADRAAEY